MLSAQEALDRLATDHSQIAPGFSIAVAEGDDVLTASTGRIKVDEPDPMGDAVRFPIGQLQKPVLAALAIHYSLNGQLDLDEPVEARLPELAAQGLPSITWSHILSETTGVADILHAEAADLDWGALAAHFSRRIQTFPPGTVWSQSYCGHLILAKAIEAVGRSSLVDQIRDVVFAPLGIDPEEPGERAAMHRPRPGRFPDLAPLSLSPLFGQVVSEVSLPIRGIVRLGRLFAGRLDHPLAQAMEVMQRPIMPTPRLGAEGGGFVPDGLSLGLAGFGGLLGASHVGAGSGCGFLFDPKGSGVAAVVLNAPNPAGRDLLLMKALAITGARPSGAPAVTTPMELAGVAGAYSGLTLGYEAALIGADGGCELQFAHDLISCQVKAHPDGRLFLVADNKWSTPFRVFPDPGDGRPALMIGASAFKRL